MTENLFPSTVQVVAKWGAFGLCLGMGLGMGLAAYVDLKGRRPVVKEQDTDDRFLQRLRESQRA